MKMQSVASFTRQGIKITRLPSDETTPASHRRGLGKRDRAAEEVTVSVAATALSSLKHVRTPRIAHPLDRPGNGTNQRTPGLTALSRIHIPAFTKRLLESMIFGPLLVRIAESEPEDETSQTIMHDSPHELVTCLLIHCNPAMKIQLSASPSQSTRRHLRTFLSQKARSISHKRCAALSRWVILFLATLSLGHAATLPDLITYNFAVAETKNIPGTSETPGPPCNGTIFATDQIQNLALVALFYQVACFTDGRYNHNNYTVERGTVSATGGGGNFPAYRIHEPQNKATQFLASEHAIYYRFPTIENYTVYSFAGGSLSKVADVPASAIVNTTTFIPVTAANPISVSNVIGSITYVFVPSATPVSSFTPLGPGVEGARVATTPFGDVLKYRYTVAGTPFDTATDFAAGPDSFANTYSNTRHFFLVRNGSAIGVVWQNQADSSLKLTWFGADRKTPTTVALANPQTQGLACATGDDAGNVYYLTVQRGTGAPNTPRNAALTKAGPNGAVITTTALDTSGTGLNMVEFFNLPNVASLKYLNGKLAVMMGRTMLQSGDGLNHQGGIAVVFNATTLAVERNWGQTSGHSWESVLTSNAAGEFVGIDLGDNFPRGVNLHKFTGTNKNSRVISGFKTLHGTTPQSPSGATYPVYTEISGGGTTYYQWSNDNRTYTELGGLAQTTLGYAASFVGERSPGGRLLDNSRVGATLNDPRNIGFLTVREDFQNASGGGTVVSDDLVVTAGLVETGGYYSFTGGWTPQRNAGVVWLTNYANTAQNASRLKMLTRADGSLLLLWEIWTGTSYVATKGMVVAQNGTVVHVATDLSSHVRLGRRDDPLRVNDAIYLAAGNKADPAVELIVIEPTTQSCPIPIVKIVRNGNSVDISWFSTTGCTYQLQTTPALAPVAWTNVGAVIAGNGTIKTVSVPMTPPKQFFHLVIQ